MSQISRDDVAHLARLARLSLTDGELEGFAGQLDAILAHVGQIQAVDVTGVEATDNPLAARRAAAKRPADGLSDVTRPDVVDPCLTQDEALAAAPNATEGRFAVPRILGDGSDDPLAGREMAQ